MAVSSKVGSVFDCPICLEKLREPKYLPCLHTFCELCIQSFIDSSISDCVINHKTISFDCPVCRRVNSAPAQNISAKEWAKQLPINHQLLAIIDSNQKDIISVREDLCDSCIRNGEQIIAKLRCKQCGNNLCKTCCKFIHERVKTFASHSIVELGAANTKVDPKDEPGNCVVHIDKPIELYCFDHEQLGCCFCLTTVHKECKIVLSLDEIADNDLENVAKSFIKETKHMSDLNAMTIQDTKKYITEINHQKIEILKNVEKNIEHIKQRLDSLHSDFKHSLRSSYEKETSDLTIMLKTLEDFNANLAKRQNIVYSVIEKGDRKNMLIATEKNKKQIADHLRNMKSTGKQMKRSLLKWTVAGAVNRLNTLKKLGEFEYTIESFDFVTPICDAIENVRLNPKSESDAQKTKMVSSNRMLRGISTGYESTCYKPIVAAFMIGHSIWCYGFSFHGNWSEVYTPQESDSPAALLWNRDKSVIASGHESLHQFETKDLKDWYFFLQIANVFYLEKAITQNTMLKDYTGKDIKAIEVLEQSIRSQVEDFLHLIHKQIQCRKESDVKYVFTVPTHSDDSIQQLIIEAALRNGIPRSSISMVLESEAAFFYHQYCFPRKWEQKKDSVGEKYLVANLGDKLSTLSVHYISGDRSANQLLRISTGPWGLESVCNEFETCLADIIGNEQMQRFKSEYFFEFIALVERFKQKFRSLKSSDSGDVITLIPLSMANCVLENTSTSLGETVSRSKYSEDVTLTNDKLRWKRDRIFQFADKVIGQIIDQTETLLASEMSDVTAILLTGHLSECGFVQMAMRKYFAKHHVLALNTAVAAVEGAVYIGHLVNSEN